MTLTAIGNTDIYSWDNGVMNGVSFIPLNGATTYTVVASDTSTGCTDTDAVIVSASSIVITGNITNAMFANDGAINITATGGALPFTYFWDNGIGSVEDPSGLSPGTYIVTVTDAYGCIETATYTIVSVAGIDENGVEISVYPNPTMGEFNLSLNGQFEYTVYSTLGQVILTGSAIDNEVVDLSRFDRGTYLLKVITEGKSSMLYIVRQ